MVSEARRIGVIGMGNVGTGMCKVLIEDGLDVFGFDVDEQAMARAREQGVQTCVSPAEVAAKSDAVILSLPQSDVVEQVCLGPGGIAESGKTGLLVVDCTSGYPSRTIEIAAKLAETGIRMIDAPITGGEGGGAHAAPNRGLTMIIGGPDADVAEATPILERMSKRLFHVGKLGNGHVIKAINNNTTFAALVTTIEGMLVAAHHGVDPVTVAKCLAVGTGQNFHLKKFIDPPEGSTALTARANFSIGLSTKDKRHFSKLAREAGVPLLYSDVLCHLAEVFSQTLGYDADTRDLVKVMEGWAGIRLDGTKLAPKDAAA